MTHRRTWIAGAALLASLAAWTLAPVGAQSAPAQSKQADLDSHLAAWNAHQAMAGTSPYKGGSWSYLGATNVSGRVTDVRRGRPLARRRRLYAGSCCGGVWKSTNSADLAGSSSIRRHPRARARSPSRRRIPTSSGLAPASRTSFAARTPASASTSPPTTRRRGRTWASPTPARSPHRRASDESRHRLCGVGRTRVDGERDARRVQRRPTAAGTGRGSHHQPEDGRE